MSQNRRKNKHKPKVLDYTVYPLSFIVLVIPLIVYLKIIPLEGIRYETWNGDKNNFDFFAYYKVVWFLISTLVLLICGLIKTKQTGIRINNKVYNILIGIYGFFIVVSTFMSKYVGVSLFGFVDRYEGMLVLLGYLVVLFVTINFFDVKKYGKVVFIMLLFSSLIVGLIGAAQFFGHDIFKTYIGKLLILPYKNHALASSLKFGFSDHFIYSTLYNSNYVGSYMAMLFPIALTVFLVVKKNIYKLASGLFSCLMLINLIGSNSRAGMVGALISALFIIIILRKQLFTNWKREIGLLVVLILIFLGMNKFSNNALLNKYSSVKSSSNADARISMNNTLQDINIEKNDIIVKTTNNPIKITLDNYELLFRDLSGTFLNTKLENNKLTFLNDKYKDYIFNIDAKEGSTILQMKYVDLVVNFAVTTDGFKIVNPKGYIADLKHPDTFGFKGKESFGSARGYIWSRTIPLLKNTVIKGYGPDTFAIYFPQDDYVGKLKAYQTMNEVVDKPHNMYLQIAINTGVISLLSVLAIFIIYLINSIKLYYKNENWDTTSIIGLASTVAFIGYAITGLFNDSVVSVAPVFWVILGLGININSYLCSKFKANSDK